MAYGMGGHAGICFQQSFGTSYVSSFEWFPIITESMNESIPPIINDGMTGLYEEGDSFEGAHEVAGDLAFNALPYLMNRVFKAWCGVDSFTAAESDYWTHIFKPVTSDFDDMAALPPMTIECYRDAGSGFLYSDCLANQITLEFAYGAFVKSTMSVIGAGFAKSAKQTPAYPTGSEFVWDQCSISLGGAAIDEMSTLSLTFMNNLEGKGTLDGSKFFNRIKRAGYRTIEVAGTILFTNQTEVDAFRAQTERRLVITTTQGSQFMEIDIPSLRYTSFPVNIGGPGQIEVGFSGSAKYNSSSGTMIEITTITSENLD